MKTRQIKAFRSSVKKFINPPARKTKINITPNEEAVKIFSRLQTVKKHCTIKP